MFAKIKMRGTVTLLNMLKIRKFIQVNKPLLATKTKNYFHENSNNRRGFCRY